MPLLEHFKKTPSTYDWQGLHGHWPSMILLQLNAVLPPEYYVRIGITLGREMEIDVATFERESPDWSPSSDSEGGGTAVATWAPAAPHVLLDVELPEPSEYVVNVFNQEEHRLVAAIELVSPSNKDREENRETFVAKCETLLKKDVCVTIFDAVSTRTANLYGELCDRFRTPRSAIADCGTYAVTCRSRRRNLRWRLEAWEHEIAVGSVLPTLPIWISEDRMVPLDLEASYMEACRGLRLL